MNSEQKVILQTNEFDQDLTFEISKDVKVTTKLTYKKGDVVEYLVEKIKKLESEVNRLSQNSGKFTEEVLSELWNNEYDSRWDKY